MSERHVEAAFKRHAAKTPEQRRAQTANATKAMLARRKLAYAALAREEAAAAKAKLKGA
jgi:hypothetical protein